MTTNNSNYTRARAYSIARKFTGGPCVFSHMEGVEYAFTSNGRTILVDLVLEEARDARPCGDLLEIRTERRPVNGLNVEWFSSAPHRCSRKSEGIQYPGRWILSGGSVAVFGACDHKCPRRDA